MWRRAISRASQERRELKAVRSCVEGDWPFLGGTSQQSAVTGEAPDPKTGFHPRLLRRPGVSLHPRSATPRHFHLPPADPEPKSPFCSHPFRPSPIHTPQQTDLTDPVSPHHTPHPHTDGGVATRHPQRSALRAALVSFARSDSKYRHRCSAMRKSTTSTAQSAWDPPRRRGFTR